MVSIIMNTSQQIINSGKETKQKKKNQDRIQTFKKGNWRKKKKKRGKKTMKLNRENYM